MKDTKLTTSLPNLQIEIRRRELPEQNAEGLTIETQATPSFDAVAASLLPALSVFVAMNSMAAWVRVMQVGWQPWLGFMGLPPLANRHEDEKRS